MTMANEYRDNIGLSKGRCLSAAYEEGPRAPENELLLSIDGKRHSSSMLITTISLDCP